MAYHTIEERCLMAEAEKEQSERKVAVVYEDGLKACIRMLAKSCNNLENLYAELTSEPLYANVSKERVKEYYDNL